MQQFGEEKTTALMSNGPEQWQALSNLNAHTHTHTPCPAKQTQTRLNAESRGLAGVIAAQLAGVEFHAGNPKAPRDLNPGGGSGGQLLVRWAGPLRGGVTLRLTNNRGHLSPKSEALWSLRPSAAADPGTHMSGWVGS